MDAKLTLKLDKTVIDEVKEYARRKNVSLSKMVEQYFRSIVGEKKKAEKIKYSPLVEELSGIISLDGKTDFKEDHTNYLMEKYQ